MSILLNVWLNIKLVLIALAIGALAGGYSGWTLKSKFVAAANASHNKAVMKDDAKALDVAQKADVKLGQEKAVIEKNTNSVLDKIVKQTPPTKQPVKKPIIEVKDVNQSLIVIPNCPSIDVGVVGMLNYLADPTAPDPSLWSDAEKQAPSSIGLRELSTQIAKFTSQYRQLAKDHDSLVDSVTEYQAKITNSR